MQLISKEPFMKISYAVFKKIFGFVLQDLTLKLKIANFIRNLKKNSNQNQNYI